MFKQRKHKTFNYKPRFSKDNKILEDEREYSSFVSKWKNENSSKRKIKAGMSIKVLILALVLLLICMYVLEKKYI